MISLTKVLFLWSSIQKLSFAFMIQNHKITKTINNIELSVPSNANIARFSSSTDEVLEVLEKRLKKGSLTDEETNSAMDASASLLQNLDDLESEKQPKQSHHQFDQTQLRNAVKKLDIDAVSEMFDAGLEMDEETTDAAFWAVVNCVDDCEEQDLPLPANMTQMLHHVFDADRRLLLQREKITTNVTCMQPDDSQGMAGAARRMNYVS